jgi:glyoxylase-like metal-dependent hydrolase (beta-lactamase superfamily II)
MRIGRILRSLAAVVALALVAFGWTFAPVKLDASPPGRWTFERPQANPPPELRISVLRTGTIESRRGLAVRGASLLEGSVFEMAPILVEHPKGTLLIDAGFGRDVDRQFLTTPWIGQKLTTYSHGTPAADQLAARGIAPSSLRGIVLTHAHWDHVSGVPDFPGVPVLVPEAERAFIACVADESALIRGFADVRYEVYAFDGGPYLGFPASHDFFGDGSVVAVPAPGHTPGSVVVFVTLAGEGGRYAFVGDLAWTLEGIEWPAERPWLARSLADRDASAARDNLRHMHALGLAQPDLRITPAHDSRALARLPVFGGGAADVVPH